MYTAVARRVFLPRAAAIGRYGWDAEHIQEQVLRRLIASAKDTLFGRLHHFDTIRTYEEFTRNVPPCIYDDLVPLIDRMRHGERDILCKGAVRWYAKSSGTTAARSKFLPVSSQGLRDTHYRGSTDTVALYLSQHPQSKIFSGKGLILGGSHRPNYDVERSLVGDLSAILLENMHPLARPFTAPRKCTALLSDFEEKRERIAQELKDKNITSLSGVPSWMLSILLHLLEETGKSTVAEVWPNLEVFYHGGIAFTPYRAQYQRIIGKDITYMETYNASEGFFGIQSTQEDPSLLLMIDYGVFYEFCPLAAITDDGRVGDATKIIPLSEVEREKDYAMLITTSSGLWRYVIGDTVRFTSSRPYKFVITGRTKSFINAFGEEVIVENADRALAVACAEHRCMVRDYTAAPVFMDDRGKGRHQWLVEFAVAPADVSAFAQSLDKALQTINSDYEAKRFKSITLQPLEVVVAKDGLFTEWLRREGKLGGQHKVPRLANNRTLLDTLLALNDTL